MGMQSLERTLERMVTGVFSRGFRANIRPIELGRRLVREMDDQRSVDVNGRRVVPNDFVVQLSQKDFDKFSEISTVLQTELVEAAREYSRAEGYHFMGPVRVELAVDDESKPGRFEVLATLRQADGAPPPPTESAPPAPQGATAEAEAAAAARGDGDADTTVSADTAALGTDPATADTSGDAGTSGEADTSGESAKVGDAASAALASTPLRSALVLPSGQHIPLGEDTVTVGRLSACTIPIQDPNVSRRHAEIRPSRTNYVVVDLGSTNGTMINGTRILGETSLSDGDIISFGSTYVRFEAS